MKQILIAILTILVGQYSQAQNNTEANGHSLFSIMPGYSVDKYSLNKKEFDQLPLLLADKSNTAGYKEVTKEGELEVCGFTYTGDSQSKPSSIQILRNFRNAAVQKGGEVLFEDTFYKDKIYLKLKKGGDVYWVKVYADPHLANYTISSIRESTMKQDVTLNAGQIKDALASEGHLSFYGIYFDTDKAVIKPESAPALAAIAAFLKNNPGKAFIVGHTDQTGDFEKNMTLSKDRAASVVQELVNNHGVNKEQLTPTGVGPLSPVATNQTDEGKARNRRVELVLR